MTSLEVLLQRQYEELKTWNAERSTAEKWYDMLCRHRTEVKNAMMENASKGDAPVMLYSAPTPKKMEEIIDLLFTELKAAEEKHPGWPQDVIHGAAIMMEEAGESIQAAYDLVYSEEGSVEHLRKELAQTGAMCIRALLNL
jgi:NTP pyrophosphatase (non-canonical NTP hydrolase)